MHDEPPRLSEDELKKLFGQLFPQGFAGTDVLAEIAPEGWEKSPLLACFHPSVEQVFRESLQLHRNMEGLVAARREREPDHAELAPKPEPTLEEVRADWKESPIHTAEEVITLIGLSLWDIFSDNHEVIAADGRVADTGSFRGSARFIAEFINGASDDILSMDYCQFYMGTIWISRRADLTPVYRLIFRRLKAMGADWVYHFPELGLVDLSSLRTETERPEDYSPSESFAKEQEENQRQEELEKVRRAFSESNEQARQEAINHPPSATVQAYQEIFDRDPRGWPPG